MVPSRANDAAHVIRLHGPWEGSKGGIRNSEFGTDGDEARTDASVVQKPDRVKVPLDFGDWLEPSFRGTVVLERAFGLPTNLDEQQSVHLVLKIDQLAISSVAINENTLPSGTNTAQAAGSNLKDGSDEVSLLRHEITSHLKARNCLRLNLTVDSKPSGGLVHAAIEIFGC